MIDQNKHPPPLPNRSICVHINLIKEMISSRRESSVLLTLKSGMSLLLQLFTILCLSQIIGGRSESSRLQIGVSFESFERM